MWKFQVILFALVLVNRTIAQDASVSNVDSAQSNSNPGSADSSNIDPLLLPPPQFPNTFGQQFPNFPPEYPFPYAFPNPAEAEQRIKNLRPDGPNSVVKGFSQSKSESVVYENGQLKSHKAKEDVVKNDNGDVSEIRTQVGN